MRQKIKLVESGMFQTKHGDSRVCKIKTLRIFFLCWFSLVTTWYFTFSTWFSFFFQYLVFISVQTQTPFRKHLKKSLCNFLWNDFFKFVISGWCLAFCTISNSEQITVIFVVESLKNVKGLRSIPMGLFLQTYIVGNASQSICVVSFIHRTICQICGKELQDIYLLKLCERPNHIF